jgi:hypothetical protein
VVVFCMQTWGGGQSQHVSSIGRASCRAIAQTDRQTDGQTDRRTERQRQTDGQTDILTHIHTRSAGIVPKRFFFLASSSHLQLLPPLARRGVVAIERGQRGTQREAPGLKKLRRVCVYVCVCVWWDVDVVRVWCGRYGRGRVLCELVGRFWGVRGSGGFMSIGDRTS